MSQDGWHSACGPDGLIIVAWVAGVLASIYLAWGLIMATDDDDDDNGS